MATAPALAATSSARVGPLATPASSGVPLWVAGVVVVVLVLVIVVLVFFLHRQRQALMTLLKPPVCDVAATEAGEFPAEFQRYREHLEELIERRSAELEQSRAHLDRSERLASLGRLATGIAHEINNPVGIILVAAQNALQSLPHGEERETVAICLRDIIDSARRCTEITQNVLKFARQERTPKTPGDLNVVLQRCVRLTEDYVQEHDSICELKLDDALPPITMNNFEMEQVFINLIKNAVEAGPDNVYVLIRTERTSSGVRAVVRDNGRGAEAATIARAFDPFFTTRREHGGTGLGLSIVHSLVTEHGGKIHVESQPNEGTQFTIDLPRISQTTEDAAHATATDC